MAENNKDIETKPVDGQEQQPDTEPKTYTQEEMKALLDKARKEGETSGFVKGKTETNAKWEKKATEREEKAKKEAQFAKMSELEKAQTQAKEYSEELQALKDQIALNEQREETRKLMKEKDLSDVFLNAVLVKGDADKTLANIEATKALIDAEIQKGVEARITTHVPKQNTEQSNLSSFEEAIDKALKIKK